METLKVKIGLTIKIDTEFGFREFVEKLSVLSLSGFSWPEAWGLDFINFWRLNQTS